MQVIWLTTSYKSCQITNSFLSRALDGLATFILIVYCIFIYYTINNSAYSILMLILLSQPYHADKVLPYTMYCCRSKTRCWVMTICWVYPFKGHMSRKIGSIKYLLVCIVCSVDQKLINRLCKNFHKTCILG